MCHTVFADTTCWCTTVGEISQHKDSSDEDSHLVGQHARTRSERELCILPGPQGSERAAPQGGAITIPQDPEKVIWGGGDPAKGSVYSAAYVPQGIKALESERLAGYTWGGPTQGTVDNAERVSRNPTHIAVGQRDILSQLNGQPIPGAKDGMMFRFTELHADIGPECLYAVTADKNYTNFGHVLGNAWDLTVFTGGEKSGSFGTWKILGSAFEDLKDMRVVHAPDNKAILASVKVQKGTFGFFVMRPDPNSDIFKEIVKEGLTLVPIVDQKLEGTYNFLEMKISHGGLLSSAKVHTTACTSVSLITGVPEATTETRARRRVEATIERVKAAPSQKFRPDLAGWRDMWDNVKAVSAEKAKAMMAEAAAAAKKAVKSN